MLAEIAPQKQPKEATSVSPPTVEKEEELLVVSFDGSVRVKRNGGAYSAVVWKLPDWEVVSASLEYATELTVNEAEYRGLLLCFDLLESQARERISYAMTRIW